MNIIKTIKQYNVDNVFFGDLQRNTLIQDSNFMRLMYSTDYFTLNGIFILVEFNNVNIEKYFSKYKFCFNVQENSSVIDFLQKTEVGILKKLSLTDKSPSYQIGTQLFNGNIKMFSNTIPEKGNIKVILKLSGIWDNGKDYGITYKFIPIDNSEI